MGSKNIHVIKSDKPSSLGYKTIIPEPKQETLEEVAKKYADDTFIYPLNKKGEKMAMLVGQKSPNGYKKHCKTAIKHFIAGANYQLQNKSFCETIKDKGELVNFLIVNALKLDDESYKALMDKLNERIVKSIKK
jgi:hypothetical protein